MRLSITTLENVYLDTISVERLIVRMLNLFFLQIYDWVCQFSMPTHHLSVQNADNTSAWGFFNVFRIKVYFSH